MKRDNIFTIASNAANGKYGPEDLLTDSFGAFLSIDKQIATAWFERITGVRPRDVVVTTQPPFAEYPHDSPDMLLESDEMVLVCEHKLGAPFGQDQLHRYLSLVQKEEVRTGIPHRLAVVGQQRMSIPEGVLDSRNYCRPLQERHYYWKDVFEIIRQFVDGEQTIDIRLRTQFLDHLRMLGLAPLDLPDEFVPVLARNTPEEKEQQYAFGEAWSPTRNWLEAKGFRTMPSSRTGLYIFPTPFSEIPNHRGVHHILITPTEKTKLPSLAGIDLPILDYSISLDDGNDELASRLASSKKSKLNSLDLPLAINRLKKLQGRSRVSFAVSLAPLFYSGNLAESLHAVTNEIYHEILAAVIA